MKKLLISSIAIFVISVVALYSNFMKEMNHSCQPLRDLSNNPQALSMLFEKLTFYFNDPTYLSRYKTINNFPTLIVRRSADINHLGIDWESLGIDSYG
jgi:hypothetical protein